MKIYCTLTTLKTLRALWEAVAFVGELLWSGSWARLDKTWSESIRQLQARATHCSIIPQALKTRHKCFRGLLSSFWIQQWMHIYKEIREQGNKHLIRKTMFDWMSLQVKYRKIYNFYLEWTVKCTFDALFLPHKSTHPRLCLWWFLDRL